MCGVIGSEYVNVRLCPFRELTVEKAARWAYGSCVLGCVKKNAINEIVHNILTMWILLRLQKLMFCLFMHSYECNGQRYRIFLHTQSARHNDIPQRASRQTEKAWSS